MLCSGQVICRIFFNCGENGCRSSYFVYTANRMSNHINQHRYSDGSLYKQCSVDHDKLTPAYDALKEMF